MRLLFRRPDGSLALTKNLEDDIPQYAIFSHTWSLDEDDEVHFEDIVHKTAHLKSAYGKVEFCMNQAAADGLTYCWIDACCINRASEPELSQAIRSMFRWYQASSKCYVYMSDVPSSQSSEETAAAFRSSRWFERGWTVQELLAPSLLEFFTKDGHRIGDREELRAIICARTGIPADALNGQSMSPFSIDDRLAWFKDRQTRRAEDMIYATFGLFDVHIPTLYGEGVENARARLRLELNHGRGSSQLIQPPANTSGSQVLYEVPRGQAMVAVLAICAVLLASIVVMTMIDMYGLSEASRRVAVFSLFLVLLFVAGRFAILLWRHTQNIRGRGSLDVSMLLPRGLHREDVV